MSVINGSMIIDTLVSGSMTTCLVCLNYPMKFFGRYFRTDLMCLPLSHLDVILVMYCLEFNHVLSTVLTSQCSFLIPKRERS